jgi:hypothetical protein
MALKRGENSMSTAACSSSISSELVDVGAPDPVSRQTGRPSGTRRSRRGLGLMSGRPAKSALSFPAVDDFLPQPLSGSTSGAWPVTVALT